MFPQWLFPFLKLALAIATFEGWPDPASLARRNNNPGNLRPVGASTGFQRFATPMDGWVALFNQIWRNVKRGLTLYEFFAGKPGVYPGYAPSSENPTSAYAAYVSRATGIAQNQRLDSYFRSLGASI